MKPQDLYLMHQKGLKSNMDRFIGLKRFKQLIFKVGLKSNMDRFIGQEVYHLCQSQEKV